MLNVNLGDRLLSARWACWFILYIFVSTDTHLPLEHLTISKSGSSRMEISFRTFLDTMLSSTVSRSIQTTFSSLGVRSCFLLTYFFEQNREQPVYFRRTHSFHYHKVIIKYKRQVEVVELYSFLDSLSTLQIHLLLKLK